MCPVSPMPKGDNRCSCVNFESYQSMSVTIYVTHHPNDTILFIFGFPEQDFSRGPQSGYYYP